MADSRFDKDQGPNTFAPKPRFGYEAPGVLSRYKWLAVAFLLVIVVAAILLYTAPRKPLTITPDPEPIYVEPLKPATP